MKVKKYKILKPAILLNTTKQGTFEKYYRIQALRNIPRHNVKVGDIGGFVSSKKILSHEGSCWIGDDATAYGNVRIEQDAYIGNNVSMAAFHSGTIIIKGQAQVLDYAIIHAYITGLTTIMDDVVISEHADIHEASKIVGNSLIKGHSLVKTRASLTGDSIVTDNAVIGINAVIHNTTVTGYSEIGANQSFSDKTFSDNGIFVNDAKPIQRIRLGNGVISLIDVSNVGHGSTVGVEVLPSRQELVLAYYNEIRQKIAKYETDIVKIIQYPLMTDKTNPYTLDMAIACSQAERLLQSSNTEEFEKAVSAMEAKFFIAESNAIRVSNSMLSENQVKKTATARKMLNIASNEGSTEHEKKTAFTQAFKELEGILTVPELAKDTFRVKVGLKELEA